jgi:AraC family transcriptional regulator, regulatory protein of adaptative response / methylated-DNA-[protein]-cysteine methyltransferase
MILTDDQCWQAVSARDRAFDGHFVTGVLTTGIYCRPSCPARHPRRENVHFFASPAQAEAAGLRACLRCLPDQISREEQAVLGAIAAIRASEEAVPLAQLADGAGYSPSHFQRLFTRLTGLSPAAYARALRRERAEAALAAGDTVTGAIYQAGYGAPSRFYADSKERTGMTASAWRNGGRGATIHWARVATSLGPMLLAATDKGICRLAFGEDVEDLRARFAQADIVAGDENFARLCAEVVESVERPGAPSSIPLDVRGTAFQEAVWAQLRAIPPGETRSYGQIAAALGKPRASRAVGQANGANPVSVLTPCHRVIAADGSLGGYAWGEAIKTELLRREAQGQERLGATPGSALAIART